MALQMNHAYHGATMTGAYHKVDYMSGNKDNLHVDIGIYENADAAAAGDRADSFSFRMVAEDMSHAGDASDLNYTKQAYEHMKAAAFDDVGGVSHDYTTATDV